MSAVSSEDSIILTKIGCDYEHQTLLLQFHTKASNRRKTKRIHIKRFIYKTPTQILDSLRRKFPEYLGNLSKEAEPLMKLLIEKLLFTKSEHVKDPIIDNQSRPNKTANTTSNNLSNPEVDEDNLLREIDLNKVSEELNQKAKSLMDREFEKKRLKPGDEGYVWDKQVEFGPAEETNDWDDDDDDEED